MDKNGDNLELQTLLNGKEEEQINEGEQQKNPSVVNGKSSFEVITKSRFCSVFRKARRSHNSLIIICAALLYFYISSTDIDKTI